MSRAILLRVAFFACVLAIALIWNADGHTARNGPFSYAGVNWRVEGSYASLFGTVKVLRTVGESPAAGAVPASTASELEILRHRDLAALTAAEREEQVARALEPRPPSPSR